MRTQLTVGLVLALTATAYADDPAPTPPPASPPPIPAPAPAEPAPAPVPAAMTASPATTLEAEADEQTVTHGFVAAKVGGIAPFDGLSPFVSVGIELGYVIPAASRRFAIVVDVDYTQPTKTGSESDPRVMGGTYTWKLTEQELGIMPVLVYRITGMKPVVPYAGIGPRVLLTRSTVQGNGSPSIMPTHEQSTRIGVGVPVGAELPLGPGAAIGELLFQYGTLNHVATGDANTGALSLSVGYRMVF